MGLLIIPLLVILIVFSFQYADAIRNPNDIAVMLSDTCKINLINNFSTYCPSYKDILEVFPDKSNHEISGGFAYNDKGFYEREQYKLQSHLQFYRYHDNPIFWVDPPSDVVAVGGAKKIVITSTDFQYIVRKQKLIDTSFDIGENRYVGSTCNYAIISANNWLLWLGDTIRLMMNNCDPAFTFYNDTKKISWVAVEHDITTSKKWQHEQYIKQAAVICKERCNEYDTIGQNGTKQVPKYQDPVPPPPKQSHPCDKDGPACDAYKYNQQANKTNTSKMKGVNAGK